MHNEHRGDDAHITTIVRFGSQARGDATSLSDHDLLVFATEAHDPVSLFQQVYDLVADANLVGHLDIRPYSPRLSPTLAFEILRDAEVLYEAAPGQAPLDLTRLAMVAEPAPSAFKHLWEVTSMGQDMTLRKIERRLIGLERRAARLSTQLSGVTEATFLQDEVLQEFTFALLYKMTQDAVDLAALLLAVSGHISPPEGAERLKMLGEVGLLEHELSLRLIGMARFRNVLAHVYEELDLVRLYQFATTDIRDIQKFGEALKSYLVSQGPAFREGSTGA